MAHLSGSVHVTEVTAYPSDGAWMQLVDAMRVWRRQGAPYLAISEMVAQDFGVEVEPTLVALMLCGAFLQPPTNRINRIRVVMSSVDLS